MMLPWSIGILSLLAIISSLYLFFFSTDNITTSNTTDGFVLASAPAGGDFTLTGSHGSVSLADFRGQLVLLYFGFTTCPDICPTNLAHLSSAMKQLAEEEQQRVKVIMITVDPERDTQEKMDVYLPYFHPSFIGLTGSEQQIAQVARQYGAVYQKAPLGEGALGYTVDHSAFTYLINATGELVAQLPHDTSGSEFVVAIRQQLH